jgi:riboflavin biosynthesis pyrimidine reductase
MLEGGGRLNGSFLNEGLIDEYYHLLLPLVENKLQRVKNLVSLPASSINKINLFVRIDPTKATDLIMQTKK